MITIIPTNIIMISIIMIIISWARRNTCFVSRDRFRQTAARSEVRCAGLGIGTERSKIQPASVGCGPKGSTLMGSLQQKYYFLTDLEKGLKIYVWDIQKIQRSQRSSQRPGCRTPLGALPPLLTPLGGRGLRGFAPHAGSLTFYI